LSKRIVAYIGLGSNLDHPATQISSALQALVKLPESTLINHSHLYQSRPMGPQDQPDYINSVAHIETALSAEQLLDQLQAIEQQQGRVRKGAQWGARTLDLDLLLYGDSQIATERLTVPHPGLHQRAFVLYPLQEVAASLEIVGLGPLEQLLSTCPRDGLMCLDEAE